MKLVIFSPGAYHKYGHSYDYCKGLAHAACELNIEVTILGYDGPLLFERPINEIRIKGSAGSFNKFSFKGKLFWAYNKISGSAHLVNKLISNVKDKTTCVIFETFEYSSLALKLHKLNFQYCTIIHDTNFNFKHSNFIIGGYKFLSRFFVKRIIKKSNKSFVHGHSMKLNLLDQVGRSLTDKVNVIPYGAPKPTISTKTDINSSKLKLGLRRDKKYLLSFGTLRKDKYFEPVLSALQITNDWEWIISGPEGDLKYSSIIEKAKELNVIHKLHIFDNFIENKDQKLYFESCDIVVNLYKEHIRHESGTAKLARSFNKPLIVSGPPDLTRYVREAGIGWVLENKIELVQILIKYQEMDKIEIDKISANIYEQAKNYSWDKVLNDILLSFKI